MKKFNLPETHGVHPPGPRSVCAESGRGSVSVVIPAFNEERTLAEIVSRVIAQPLVGEVVIVDDKSVDGTCAVAEELAAHHEGVVALHRHPENYGKGAALRTGFAAATRPVVIVQDADFEYNPDDYEKVVRPILDDEADIVYGSRYAKREKRLVLRFWHTTMNRLLTLLSNVFSDLHLTDMETCYKAFRREIIQRMRICENRFGFEPEITARVARGRYRVIEVPIDYAPRSYEEGKKIGLPDGIRALFCIVWYNWVDRDDRAEIVAEGTDGPDRETRHS